MGPIKKNIGNHPTFVIPKDPESSTKDHQVEYVLFERIGDIILLRFYPLKNNQFPEKSHFPGSSNICDYTAVYVL